MPFVKLDCGILRSTLWFDRGSRDVFLTALLMAEPAEFDEQIKTYDPNTGAETAYVVPPGAYGFVEASGPGLIRYSLAEPDEGKEALVRLCSPEPESRTPDFEGRRMVRIDGGFLVLNYAKYREKDYTAADRMRRYRERIKAGDSVTSRGDAVTIRSVTQAEAEAEAYAEAEVKPELIRESVTRFVPPSVEEVKAYAHEKSLTIDADYFVDFFEAKGWITGKSKMRSWRAAVRTAARDGWTTRRPKDDARPSSDDPRVIAGRKLWAEQEKKQ
jgi:hypothetical protein